MMIRAVCILALACACLALPKSDKIVGGTIVPQGKYPFMVNIRYSPFDLHICGGTILNEYWILTAAHCIDTAPDGNWEMYVGDVKLYGDEAGGKYNVTRFVLHPDYEPNLYEKNDIGLIQVKDPINFNENVQPVTLPAQGQITPVGSDAIAIGWGYPESGGNLLYDLQETTVSTYDDDECNRIHFGVTHPSNICAGVPVEGGKGICTGDLGGPLMVNGEQIGVMSWFQEPCALEPFPDVYVEVSLFVDWINSYINSTK